MMTREEYNALPKEKLGEGSEITLEKCETEHDLYWKMAIEVVETISENNKKGEPTVMVVPYGPLGPYSRIAYLVNKYEISLKKCVFINMDEYVTNDGRFIDRDDPLSFRGGMDRTFYNKVREDLNVLPENRIFPTPGKEHEVLEIIEKYGKLDMAWGGVGINGHFAFNEPPAEGEVCDVEEFKNRPTRILNVSLETRTVNSFMNCGGDIQGIPEKCITVGMKEMFMAKKVRMCQPRDWNAGALRKILHGEITPKVPCSIFRLHPDAKLYAAEDALSSPIPAIRIYNK
ncbi:MAG: glucosamine-6-phosphate isomerase [Clostridia bacterium]|nr:glucosamine-6-phosphate isomerase [Clostridia bacterium]